MAPQRGEKDWEGSPVGGCLPTKRSLLGTGGLYEDVGEKALRGRVPMEGLIPISRFWGGGVLLYRRSGVDYVRVFVVIPEVCCYIGGLWFYLEVLSCVVIPDVRGCTPEFSFVVGSCCSQGPRFRPNKGSAHNLAIGFDPAREY